MDTVGPTVRTFRRLRRELMAVLDVDRRDVRPSTRLEDLVSPNRRRAVWRQLRRRGLDLPELVLSPRAHRLALTVMAAGLGLFMAFLQGLLVWLATLRLGAALYAGSRPFAVHLGCGPVTLRDAAVYFTNFKDNKGYRWSRQEISTKVRLILSESLCLPLDEVKFESRLIDDLGCC